MTSTAMDVNFRLNRFLRDASQGDSDAFFQLGIAYAAGRDGAERDLVQAHKWFNLATLSGDDRAQQCRADLAEEMSTREIAEAQRQARAWWMDSGQRAA
jgi:TPR repeat protein